MVFDLIYEKDKERVYSYQSRIEKLLDQEEEILSGLSDPDINDETLDMLLLKTRRQEMEAARLSRLISEDMEKLSGEYLSATAVYRTTAEEILSRFSSMREMITDASEAYKKADATRDAAEIIKKLNSFSKGVRGEQ